VVLSAANHIISTMVVKDDFVAKSWKFLKIRNRSIPSTTTELSSRKKHYAIS
jgi:hypothetical protein